MEDTNVYVITVETSCICRGDRGLLYVTFRISRKLNGELSTFVGSLVVQATLETLRIFTLLFDLKGIGFGSAILTRRPLFVCEAIFKPERVPRS